MDAECFGRDCGGRCSDAKASGYQWGSLNVKYLQKRARIGLNHVAGLNI